MFRSSILAPAARRGRKANAGASTSRASFPPLPNRCRRHGWVLKNTTAAVEVLHGVSKAVPVVETAEPR